MPTRWSQQAMALKANLKKINNKKSASSPSYISVLILRINQKRSRTDTTIHSQILEFQFYWHYTILYYTTDVAWPIYTVCWFTTFWLLKSTKAIQSVETLLWTTDFDLSIS